MSQPQKLEEALFAEHMGGVQSQLSTQHAPHHAVVSTTVLRRRCLPISPIL